MIIYAEGVQYSLYYGTVVSRRVCLRVMCVRARRRRCGFRRVEVAGKGRAATTTTTTTTAPSTIEGTAGDGSVRTATAADPGRADRVRRKTVSYRRSVSCVYASRSRRVADLTNGGGQSTRQLVFSTLFRYRVNARNFTFFLYILYFFFVPNVFLATGTNDGFSNLPSTTPRLVFVYGFRIAQQPSAYLCARPNVVPSHSDR